MAYRRLEDGSFIPEMVYDRVRRSRDGSMPADAKEVYRRYVVLTYLRPYTAIPFFLALFILLLYLLGKFMAIGIGRFFWGLFEQAIHRLPLVRSVYAAVKQVTDFFFRDQPSQFRRVVAVEYPHGDVERRFLSPATAFRTSATRSAPRWWACSSPRRPCR